MATITKADVIDKLKGTWLGKKNIRHPGESILLIKLARKNSIRLEIAEEGTLLGKVFLTLAFYGDKLFEVFDDLDDLQGFLCNEAKNLIDYP